MKRINIDRKKCIGCLMCTTGCKVSHDCSDEKGHVTVTSEGQYCQIYCRHCTRPECVYACPTGAMTRNHDTGYVLYDKSRCASCFMCIMSCPYGVLKMDRFKNMEVMKCDMCFSTKEQYPQCVARCPMGALTLKEVEY